jgi:hypothetical protein
MKKIILLLLSFLFIENIKAYDLTESFYYNDEKVENMWITKVNEKETLSGLPFLLKRKSDNDFVYCLQPFVMLKQEENYHGYFDINEKFLISSEDLERIRLLAHFGYKYKGHEDIKWYGITQYLIWKTVDNEADIYFTDTRYGNRINVYQNEIKEIELLISEYLKLIEFNNKKMVFNNIDDFIEWKDTNIFLNSISADNKQNIIVPNTTSNEKEIFFYHENGQNVYLKGYLEISNITFEIEFIKEIIIRKWYGSGKYELEQGAKFEIYKDNELIDTVETDEYGIAYLSLPYGIYNIIQVKGIDGYRYVDPFEINVGVNGFSDFIELYDDIEIVRVPDTSKNVSYFLFTVPLAFLFRKILC